MRRFYILPDNPDKLCLHVAGYCPAVKSADVAARQGLQRGGGSHYCTILLSHCPLQQSILILPVRNASPDHNGAIPKHIPFVNASLGEAFTSTSVYMTSTIRAVKSKRDSSLKRIRLLFIIANRVGALAVNHAIRRNQRA